MATTKTKRNTNISISVNVGSGKATIRDSGKVIKTDLTGVQKHLKKVIDAEAKENIKPKKAPKS